MSKRDEFGTVAGWTAEAILSLGLADPIPAACNGSGNPAWLEWLAERLGIGPGVLVLDTGAGLGGPPAWLASRTGADVLVAEPMAAAGRGCRRLFDLPGVISWSHRLPLAAGSLDVALALAVLSTVEDKSAYLAEVRRVLAPGGRLGLVEYVAEAQTDSSVEPEGNDFLSEKELLALLEDSGFSVRDQVAAERLAPAPPTWDRTDSAVVAEVERRHGESPEWKEAAEQRQRFGRLLGDGTLGVLLVHAARDD